MNRNAYDNRQAQRRRPGSLLALCCLCLVLIGATSLVITVLVTTNRTTTAPPAMLVCDDFTDFSAGDVIAGFDCSDNLSTAGVCNGIGNEFFCVNALVFQPGQTDSESPLGISERSTECTAQFDPCTIQSATVCERSSGGDPNIERFAFTCVAPPTPEPTPALRCGLLSNFVPDAQPEVSTCAEPLPGSLSGVCSGAGVCAVNVVQDGSSSDNPFLVSRACDDPMCQIAGTGCACANTVGLGCVRQFEPQPGAVATIVMECVDETTPAANDFQVLADELRAMEDQLDLLAGTQGALAKRSTLIWSQFATDVRTHANSVVELRQSDFDHGTLRIQAPGHFILTEDIVFRPNPGAFFGPTAAQLEEEDGDYPFSEFPLDFHAAIGVESDNVLIDLNGYTLSASREWHTKQSFGMLIELGNSVFIVGDGPAAFADPFFGPSNVVIRNGVLGFNQHHAIHGNPGSNVYLHDIDFDRYHIAAIALNGVQSAMIENCVASGTNTDLSLLGTWSQAHFLDRFLRVAEAAEPAVAPIRQHLDTLVKQAFTDTVANNRVNQQTHPEAYALFANRDRMVDGNVYGLLLTNHGAAVEQFDHELDKADAGYRIYVKDFEIRDTANSVQEHVALIDENGKEVRGPAGDLFAAHALVNADGTLVDKLNAIQEAQLAFASAHAKHGRGQWNVGSLSVPQALIDWYDAGADMSTFVDLVVDNGWRYGRNTDAMFHVDKGATGIRADSVYHAYFENVIVDGVLAHSPPGHDTLLPGEQGPIDVERYTKDDYGHPAQGLGRGYAGHRARGTLLAADEAVDMRGVIVRNVRSTHGPSIDCDTFPHVVDNQCPMAALLKKQ